MSLIVRYGDRLLQITRGVESTPDRWLIGLRWIATFGILSTILAARRVVPGLRIAPLLAIMGVLVTLNVAWVALHLVGPPRRGATLAAQILLDVPVLGGLLWYSGGLENPFAPFLVFQVVLAGMLTSSRTTIAVAALTVAVAAVLHGAPPLPLDGALWPAVRVREIGRLMALVSLGSFLGYFVVLFARRLEQLYDESARNERLAALGRTVAAMCHELNTPLGTIVIAGKDLEQIGGAAGSSEIQELARAVTHSASRASDIIGLLRGAVRPNAVTERVELSGFVDRVARQELRRLGYAGELVVDAPAAVEVPVIPTALSQILANLLQNAVDALRGAPSPRIEVAVRPRDGGADVRITDNGSGVSPGILPRLGEPFQTTKAEGTGLGLYVSSLLAERMGGRLELENLPVTGSGPGAGARLTLALRTEEAA